MTLAMTPTAMADLSERARRIEQRITQLTVVPKSEPLFSERATRVRIEDEAGGEFVEVEQSGRKDISKIMIDPEEWPALRAAINRMIRQCKAVG